LKIKRCRYWDVARRLIEQKRRFDLQLKLIGDFIPHSSILAPGVLDDDQQIRPKDEVIVEGEKFFGVGRALISGVGDEEVREGCCCGASAFDED
jgi:predicted RNA-binding protein